MRSILQGRCLSILVLVAVFAAFSPAYADPASPIDVTISDTPDPVASGGQLVYTITMTNTGGARVDNVLMTHQLNGVGGIGVPPQLQITSSRGSCSQTTTLVTCNGGVIEGRGTWVVSIRGIVTAADGTVINNTVSVNSTKSAQNFTSTLTETTMVSGGSGSTLPDLSIFKNGPTSVPLSSPMTYTLTVNNTGTANATGVTVVDTVPAGLTGITASGTSLFDCSVAGQTVTCSGGAVNQGSNATITINATSPAVAGTITNTAAVDPDDLIDEANELNNTSALVNTAVIDAPAPPEVTIGVDDSKDPITPGELLTYTILVQNNSTQRADDVVVVNGTQGLVASSVNVNFTVTNGAIGTHGGCTVAASEARCVVRSLNAGGTILMTVSGSVIASAGSTIINTATVSWNIKNRGYAARDTELTTVKPDVDLTITNVGSPDPVCASSWPGNLPAPPVCRGGLTYTFVVGNSGINPANNVTVRNPLPVGSHFDSFSAPAFAGGCSVDSGNILTCTGGTIPPESTTTITIVLVAPPGTGTIFSTATVDPNNAIFEADETNNIAVDTTLVVTGVDLIVSKVASLDPVATSGTETYTITVDNIGTQNATNIRVRDTLPAETRFRDVIADNNFTCSHASGVVECVGGSIMGTASEFYPPFGAPGNDTATIVIRVFAQPFEGTMHNEVRVDPLDAIPEANELNNFGSLDVAVTSGGAGLGAFNQFTITKSQVSPANPVARNAKVVYSIVVGNDGTDPATGITVRDFLPAGARYVEASGTNEFECSQSGNHINCVGGEIAAGGNATLTITMFAPDTPGSYTQQAIVDPDNTKPEGNEFDNAASVITVVENAGNGPFNELSITKTQTTPANPVARGGIVTYTIAVTNSGSNSVTGIRVRDTLPTGMRFIQATGTNQFLCSHSSGVVECLGGQLSGGGNGTITVKAFAPDVPGTYTNQAFVDPENSIPEGDEENNHASVDTVVENGGNGPFNDLTILKTGTSATTPGGPIAYTLQVWNNGSDPALNVKVRDVLPPGVTFVSAADSGGAAGGPFTCSHSSGIVECIGGTLDGGGVGNARTIAISVKAPNAVVTSPGLRNEARIDPDNEIPEGDELNNSSATSTDVTAPLNLTVKKTGPTTATQSNVTDYTITVTNTPISGGGAVATGVVMRDPLPVGLIPLAVDAGGSNNWGCQVLQNPINVVECIGDLDRDDSVTIKITVFITAESGRSLDNTACVDPDNLIVESNELDNCSEFGSFVAPPEKSSPDLLVSKQVDSLNTTPGASLTYTINVSNSGSAKAKGWDGMSGLTLTDSLPSQVSFVNFSTTNGWTCTESAGTVTCHDDGSGMSPGGSAQITILATVSNSAAVPIANTAAAAPALVDITECSDPLACEDEPVSKRDNNVSTVVSSIGSSGVDLALSSITDIPDPVAAGQALKYTIVGVNGGTSPANNVPIDITIPSAGVTFVNADGSNGFNCNTPVGTLLTCTGDLPAGGNTTITVNFITLVAGLPPDVTLAATIDPADAFAEIDEGNNTETEVTTISPLGTCSMCVDLVAAQLIASPEPVSGGGSVTVKYQIVNVGDQGTTLNPASQPLLWLDAVTNLSIGSATPTSSDPAITCQVDVHNANQLLTSCNGNLAPGQGVTITLVVPAVDGSELTIFGRSDPTNVQMESNETNNNLTQSVVID